MASRPDGRAREARGGAWVIEMAISRSFAGTINLGFQQTWKRPRVDLNGPNSD